MIEVLKTEYTNYILKEISIPICNNYKSYKNSPFLCFFLVLSNLKHCFNNGYEQIFKSKILLGNKTSVKTFSNLQVLYPRAVRSPKNTKIKLQPFSRIFKRHTTLGNTSLSFAQISIFLLLCNIFSLTLFLSL